MTSKLCKSAIFESTVQRQGNKFVSHEVFFFGKKQRPLTITSAPVISASYFKSKIVVLFYLST